MDQDTRIMALEYIWNAWDNVTKVYEDGAVFSAYQNQTTTSSCYQGGSDQLAVHDYEYSLS